MITTGKMVTNFIPNANCLKMVYAFDGDLQKSWVLCIIKFVSSLDNISTNEICLMFLQRVSHGPVPAVLGINWSHSIE